MEEHHAFIQAKIKELTQRDWDLPAIKNRFDSLVEKGTSGKSPDRERILKHKGEILDRVQRHGEEYCYLTRNCAKGSAAALLEEFGLGNMEIVKALVPFPGIAMTGGICGGVTGGLIALSLYFSGEDLTDFEDRRPFMAARVFTDRFERALGSLLCPEIQKSIFGKYFDPTADPRARDDFNNARARDKCPLAPGMGARIAAEIIIESLEKDKGDNSPQRH